MIQGRACAPRVRGPDDHDPQVRLTPFDVLNVEGVQNATESRYQHW